MKSRKSPQQKKALSLAKDRRNNYGENKKSSRKNIPRSKAALHRGYRRSMRRSLLESGDNCLGEPASAAVVRKSGWRKSPDIPLGDYIHEQRVAATQRAQRQTRR